MPNHLRIVGALVRNQVRMTLRIRIAFFFTVAVPMLMFFVYAFIFGRGDPATIRDLMGPVVVFTVTSTAIYGIGMQLVVMRENGTLRPFQMTPATATHLLLSRLLTNYIFLSLVIALQFLLAFLLFGVKVPTPLTLFGVISVGMLSICSVGLFIATLVNSSHEANVTNQLAFFAVIFLSGVTMPLASLPATIQKIAAFLPTTHLNVMIKLIMNNGSLGMKETTELFTMAFAGMCFFLIAAALFRWDRYSRVEERTRKLALLSLLPYLACGIAVNSMT